MAYIGKSPTPVPLSVSDLDDDIVSLAKLAGGTDGNIISYDASGDPVAIATGNDGQVLTSAGAGQPCAFEATAGGDFVKLATVTADPASDATADINGYFTSDYDVYKLYGTEVRPGTDDQDLHVRVMIADSIDSNSIYAHNLFSSYLDSTPNHSWQNNSYSDTDAPSDSWVLGSNDQGNDTEINSWVRLQIYNPLSTTRNKMMEIIRHYHADASSGAMICMYSSCWIQTTSALTGVSFHFDSGNIGGSYKLYGLK